MKQKHTLYPGCILFLCRKAFPKRSILNIPEMCHKAEGDSLHSIEFYFLLKGGNVWELSPISLTTLCLPAESFVLPSFYLSHALQCHGAQKYCKTSFYFL